MGSCLRKTRVDSFSGSVELGWSRCLLVVPTPTTRVTATTAPTGDTEYMDWTFRTVVRLFMLVGGGFVLVFGLINGDAVNVAIGVAGVVLGGVGLVYESRQESEQRGEIDSPK